MKLPRLYYAPGSSSLASRIVLADAAIEHVAVRLDLQAGDQRAAGFLAINPKGRVPVLVTGRGVLTETPAILAYVGQQYPDAALIPASPFEFARVQEFNHYLCATVHVAHAHGRRAERWTDDPAAIAALRRRVGTTMGECFAFIENRLEKGSWVLGRRYTICDPYLFTLARWLELDGVDPARFPKVLDHRRRMCERPVVGRILEEEARLP